MQGFQDPVNPLKSDVIIFIIYHSLLSYVESWKH